MKKRWLICLSAIAMVLTLCFGIAACGDTEADADKARAAIDTIKVLYEDNATITNTDYQLFGQVKGESSDTWYDVVWTASSTAVDDIETYVKIGEMDANNRLVTVSIKQSTEKEIPYTLKATVTVGSASESAEFARKIEKGVDRDVQTTKATLSFASKDTRTSQDSNKQVWEQNGIKFTNDKASSSNAVGDYANPVRLYQSSKVTIEFPGIIHIDFFSASNQPETYDTPHAFFDDLKNSLTSAFPEAEITEDATLEHPRVSVEFQSPMDVVEFSCGKQLRLYSIDVEGKEGGASDADKVASVKATLALSQVGYFMLDSATLPAEKNGVNISWKLKENSEYASVAQNTLTISKLPEKDNVEVVLVATLTLNDVTETKELTVTIKPAPAVQTAGTAESPYTATDAKAVAKLIDDKGYYSKTGVAQKVYVKGYVVDKGKWDSGYGNWTNVYIADSATSTKDSADAILVYRLVADGTFLAKDDSALKVGATITVCGFLQNYGDKYEVTYNGSENVTATAYNYVDDRTADQKITDALAAVPATLTVSATGETVLPATTEPEVTFTWALKDGEKLPQGTAFADGKLTVTTLPAADTTVKFVVTAKLTGATDQTKEISVTIKAEGAVAEGFTPITAPAAGSDYYLAMDIKGTWYYSTGAKSGNYLGTTTDISKAAKVTLAASGSGWTLVTNGKYIEFESSTSGTKTYVNIMLKDSQTTGKVWTWNEEHSVFTMDEGGETYFMGTFGDYTTFNSAKISFIDGKDEYIGKIGTYTGTVEPEPELADPTKGTAIDEQGATVFDFSDVAVAEANDYSEMSETAILAAFDNFEGLTLTKSKIYAGNNNATSGPSDYRSAGGFLRMGSGSANGTLTLTFTKDITKIQILCLGWSASDTIAIDGFNPATIDNTAQVAYTYTLTEAVKSFTITTAKRALIFKIAVTFADGSDEPQPDTDKTATYDVSTKNYSNGEKVTTVTEGDVTFTFSKGSGSSDPAYYDDKTAVRLYSNNTLTVSVGEGYYITKIVITFAATGDSTNNAITVNKGTFTTNTWEGSTQAVVLTAGGTSGHRKIVSVEVTYVATTHVHHYNVAHNEGAFTHTYTCDVEGCYDQTYTEPCALENNVCSACHENYTEKQIKDALFALSAGQSLPGDSYQLMGKVLRIDSAYDSKFGNVTFTMKIDNHEVQAYRTSGEKAATVKPGDTVTVKGGLTNFKDTYQFSAGTILTLTEGDLTAEEKVAEVKLWLTLPEASGNTITLPTVPDWASGVSLSAVSNTTASLTVEGTTLTLIPGDKDVDVTVTVTISCEGTDSVTKEFTVKVPAKLPEGGGTATYDPSKKYTANTKVTTETVDGVTLTFEKNGGTDPQYYTTGTAIRAYAKNKITVSVPTGKVIVKITLTFGDSDGSNEITAEGGTGTYANGVWTGSAESVVFTIGGTSGNRRIAKIEVVYAPVPAAAAASVAPVAILPGKQF